MSLIRLELSDLTVKCTGDSGCVGTKHFAGLLRALLLLIYALQGVTRDSNPPDIINQHHHFIMLFILKYYRSIWLTLFELITEKSMH